MGTRKRYHRRAKQGAKPNRLARGRSATWSNRLLWVAGSLTLVVALVLINLRDSNVFAQPSTASRDEELSVLLPLAEPKHGLTGTHDMELIPQETPMPQPVPLGVPVARLEIPSASYDFGRISHTGDVAHTFAVQNTGDADLVVTNLVTSCGCTTAELSSSVIPPGQRADLRVVFDPDFHDVQGEVTRLVWFATNDPARPWVEVRIRADVQS
jgi:hypothetical protein